MFMSLSQPKLYELASNFKNIWLFKSFLQYYSTDQEERGGQGGKSGLGD